MTKTTTDIKNFDITIIEHGNAKIYNVVAPTSIEKNTPFQIKYDCKNEGTVQDLIYGQLYQNDVLIGNSTWSENIPAGTIKPKIYNHAGISIPVTIKIETGHE